MFDNFFCYLGRAIKNDFRLIEIDYKKVLRVIKSCQCEEHLDAANKLITLFYIKYKNDFLFSFQLKDKNDIQTYIEEANNTSLALFKKSKTFIDDYVETREMSYEEKLKDLDLMIESFIEEERYEDCAFLVKIKDKVKLHYIKQKLRTDE